MGTHRKAPRYDVHCLECGESYEEKYEPEMCTKRRCNGPVVTEENTRYQELGSLFAQREPSGIADTPDFPLRLEY